MVYCGTLIWCQLPSAGICVPGKPFTPGKLVVPASVVCRLMLMVWIDPSVGTSCTHTLMEYCDPTYILLATLICGPSKLAMRPVTSRLWLPECASAVVLVSVELPECEPQPSKPPSSKVEVIPVLSCSLTGSGGCAVSPMTTSLM